MIQLSKLLSDFRDCLGWPYVSPGTNDSKGIDCSGMFVRAYRLQGSSIYHGSNTIWRQHLSDKGRISSVKDLQPGYAVFKQRNDGNEPSRYRDDGQGNFYHIGLVLSVNPLEIIHASTKATAAHPGGEVRIDRELGTWTRWGRLSDVNYGTEEMTIMGRAIVATAEGSLNMRMIPNKSGSVLQRIPKGETVEVLNKSGEWWYIHYNGQTGYCASQYLRDAEDEPLPFDNDDVIKINREDFKRLVMIINEAAELLSEVLG